MGTSCIIKVEGVSFANVYKHYDGYPSSMNKWLVDFNKAFVANRGDDPQYKFAQLLRSSAWDYSTNKDSGNRSEEYTGWGVVPPGGEKSVNYVYELKANGDVTSKWTK